MEQSQKGSLGRRSSRCKVVKQEALEGTAGDTGHIRAVLWEVRWCFHNWGWQDSMGFENAHWLPTTDWAAVGQGSCKTL